MSVRAKFTIVSIGCMALAMAAAGFFIVNRDARQLEQEARNRAHMVLHFGRACRSYVKEVLRPSVEQLTDDMVFEAMSATLVTRSVLERFTKEFPDYSYRQPTPNPLNLVSKADEFEARLVERFDSDRTLTELSGYRMVNGEETYYTALPIVVEARCLACHGSPETSLPAVVERYGREHGYNWQPGQVVSTVMVSVPTKDLRDHQAGTMWLLVAVFACLAAALGAAIWIPFERLVDRRIRKAVKVMRRVAEDPLLPSRLDDDSSDELGVLARSFNDMADSLRESRLFLEQRVEERTRELGDVNAELNKEVLERRRADDELRRSEARTRAIVDHAGDGIITIDERGIIESFNAAAEDIFGYAAGEAIGKNLSTLMPSPHREHHGEYLARYLRTGEAKVLGSAVEVAARRKDGSAVPIELTVSEIHLGDRRSFTGIIRNITERKRAEQERARLIETEHERNHLKEAVAAQEQLLAVVGHELRTPLAALRATSEFLLTDDAGKMQEWDFFLRSINGEVVRMGNMVNDLLEAARLNSGTAHWKWGTLRLAEVCRSAVDSIRPLVDAAKVDLGCSVEPSDLAMNGDGDAICRLVLNLLSNAQKHTKEGSIRVLARFIDEPGESGVEIEVRDTGEGIAPEVADRLGTAFALNAGVIGSDYVQGAGLGLAICKGIVAAHGGTMAIRSNHDQGTTVTIRLRSDLAQAAPRAGDLRIEQEIAA